MAGEAGWYGGAREGAVSDDGDGEGPSCMLGRGCPTPTASNPPGAQPTFVRGSATFELSVRGGVPMTFF